MKPDVEKGDRFLVDLILGIKGGTESFRLTEHVYQKKGSQELCLPEGLNWNSMATVYFVIPVKNDGKWVHHFVDQITKANELTEDTNFHVIIVDFESSDIDLAAVFDTPLLKDRHTILSLPGRFYKTLALNKAVASIPNDDDIILVFELHIDVPADLLESIRKVNCAFCFPCRLRDNSLGNSFFAISCLSMHKLRTGKRKSKLKQYTNPVKQRR